MSSYSQSDIDSLVSCVKTIQEPPQRNFYVESGYWRKDALLVANGYSGTFHMFLRINEDFAESFSTGLRYLPNDRRGEIVLLRCDGKHGDFNKILHPEHPHFYFHVHRASQQAVDRGERAESRATITNAYASFEEALQSFIETIHLDDADAEKHFPQTKQRLLFDIEGAG